MNSVKGTAIYLPVCSHKTCCKKGDKIHHLTLTHLETTDHKVIAWAIKCIEEFIQISEVVKGNHPKIVEYTLGKEGKRSTKLEGDVEVFKKTLDVYLRSEPRLSKLISPYRRAHVDRFNRKVEYYKNFRVEDLRVMKDH